MRLIVLALVLCNLPLLAQERNPPTQTLTGKVVTVHDGDTVTVLVGRKQVRVRFNGIDAPESSQAFGSKSRDALKESLQGKTVRVVSHGEDKYGRMLGDVYLESKLINAAQVEAGLAWHYKQYSKDPELAKLEEQARAVKKGLWSDPNPIPPWEFRRSNPK